MDRIRILRVIEIEGPRDKVEEQVRKSIQGQRNFGEVTIRAGTIGDFATILFDKTDEPLTNREPFISYDDNGVESFVWFLQLSVEEDQGTNGLDDPSVLPKKVFDALQWGELVGSRRRYITKESAMFDLHKATGEYPKPE